MMAIAVSFCLSPSVSWALSQQQWFCNTNMWLCMHSRATILRYTCARVASIQWIKEKTLRIRLLGFIVREEVFIQLLSVLNVTQECIAGRKD